MPKRKANETREERWARKLKKYEEKIHGNKRSRRVIYSSEDEDHGVQPEEHLEQMESEYMELDMLSENLVGPVGQEEVAINEDTAKESNDDFDLDLIQSLGNVEAEPEEFSEEIHADLAARYQNILINGLNKESKDVLLKKYLPQKNMPLSRAPTLNLEIEGMLVENCRLRAKRLTSKQEQLGKALSALGMGITGLLKKNINIPQVIQTLNDVGKLLADSHYAETDTRRTVIIPLMEKSLADTFKNRKRDKFLFGENLGEAVKTSRGIAKTSQLIQAQATTTRSLNFKGPPLRARQPWFSHNNQPRTGGQRTPYVSRGRRTGPYNPPPLPRRQPPPPPARRQPALKQRTNIPERQR